MAGTDFNPTREAGLERLERFIPRATTTYAAGRNFDHGPGQHNAVSGLSPWLRHRLVTEQEVIEAVLSRFALPTTEKFVQEVFWRAYFKGWLEQRPQVWQDYRRDVDQLVTALENNNGLAAGYNQAVSATTGIECFDHWIRELTETGYLHNHARMWFASIWIFTLGLPWQLGADFFYRYLVDGDAASNTLSWRWVGGLHTKGKTYLARADNICKYTDDRFNPEGQLACDAPPLQEESDAPIEAMPEGDAVDPGLPYILLLHEDDCHAESLGLQNKPVAIAGLSAAKLRSPLPVSSQVQNFASEAVNDSIHVAREKFKAEGAAVLDASDNRWAESLMDLARKTSANQIVMPYAPVGPVAEALGKASPVFEKAGLKLCRMLRPYDAAAWPHATKGFFKLKKKIPQLIDRF